MEWTIPPSINPSTSKISTLSSIKSITKYLNNLTHYTQIFQGNRYNQRNISTNNLLLLTKQEFDIFYSTKYKYPLLVAETITSQTGLTDPNHPYIDRRQIEDPFRQDLEVPANQQHTLEDYKAYMEYGGSMGHNAPAGQHKTNMDVYNETFVLTNITPQEMVFNSGLWVLMEQWCRNLGRNHHIEKVMVMTGSIPAMFDNNFNGVIMNVPRKMFKIICIKMPEHPDTCFVEIFLCQNKPYTINYSVPKYDLSSFLVPHSQYAQFQRESGVDLKKLLEYYGFHQTNTNINKIKSFSTIINMSIQLHPVIRLLMKKSKWFGRLIYARNLDILEREWIECQKLSIEFQNLQFHKEYYELAKKRMNRNSYLSRTIPINYTWVSFYNQSLRNTTRKNKNRKSNNKYKPKSKSNWKLTRTK